MIETLHDEMFFLSHFLSDVVQDTVAFKNEKLPVTTFDDVVQNFKTGKNALGILKLEDTSIILFFDKLILDTLGVWICGLNANQIEPSILGVFDEFLIAMLLEKINVFLKKKEVTVLSKNIIFDSMSLACLFEGDKKMLITRYNLLRGSDDSNGCIDVMVSVVI